MKVLNFGSLNYDYVYRVPHIVMEGETISSGSLEKFCGGKGLNQSIALKKAGAEVYHAGSVGNDGGELKEKLCEYGVNTQYIRTIDVPTGHAFIQLDDNGQNSIVLFGGANQSQDKDFIDSVLDEFTAGDYIVLQNEINFMDYIIDEAYERNMFIVLNPSPYNSKIEECDLSKVSLLSVNEVEGEQITGKKEPKEIIGVLLEKYPALKILLTLGSKGAIYADKDEYIFQPALGSEVKDTTAAGDTFSGYFIAGTVEKMSPKDTILLAAKASAVTISRVGAADSIPLRKELDK